MSAQPTPGAWTLAEIAAGGFAVVALGQGKHGGTLVICSRTRLPGREVEMQANARVLCASKHLLEAAERALACPRTRLSETAAAELRAATQAARIPAASNDDGGAPW